ncbi:protein of unknown function [Rhodovastum atsumiense]|nr:protein of unknown function [Rhodovastum atsumiense]
MEQDTIFTNEMWAMWEPLIEEVRPRGKTPPKELRRTISAIFWRHQNGAKWRDAVRIFAARYNATWPIEKNGYRSPLGMRAA